MSYIFESSLDYFCTVINHMITFDEIMNGISRVFLLGTTKRVVTSSNFLLNITDSFF